MRYFSILRYLAISLVLVCSACGTALPTVKPYKLDVQQGNVVTSKMLLQLRPGMTKSQVRFIMGTPLIQDSFHGNRWDYVYQMREAGKVTEQRRVILDFEKDLLKSVRGDVTPAGSDPAKSDESKANTGTRVVEPYKKPEEKSVISKLKFWEKDDTELAKEAAEKEAAAKAKAEQVAKQNAAEMLKKTNEVAVTEQHVAVEAPVEEPKSILAIPVETAPPVTVAVTEAVPATVQEVAAEGPAPVVEAVKVEVVKTTEAIAAEVAPVTVKVPVYESASGMIFDRNLRSLPPEPEPEIKAEVAAPRAGNKEIPKPKALPAENDASFFDRMLEMIGF